MHFESFLVRATVYSLCSLTTFLSYCKGQGGGLFGASWVNLVEFLLELASKKPQLHLWRQDEDNGSQRQPSCNYF